MNTNAGDFAVLIPACNEVETIGEVIRRVRKHTQRIIVVDDGSTDGTGDLLSRQKDVVVLTHAANRKKGAALQTGMRHARENGIACLITLDGDGQHDPDDIPHFLEAHAEGRGNLLVGTRFGVGGERPDQMPTVRQWSNKISSWLISRLAGVGLQDIQCGYRLYETRILDLVTSEETGFNFETEVVVKAARAGLRVGQVPIRCLYPEGAERSRYRTFLDSWNIARAAVRSRWGRM